MSQRSFSPRRYGRSEHAPIVIDMVDYGADDYDDDFTYNSGHFPNPLHPSPRLSSPPHRTSGNSQQSPRHTSSRTSTTPRHLTLSSRHKTRSPRNLGQSSNNNSSTSSSPSQAVHMHNFAQRRSFMMGGAGIEKEEYQDDVKPNRVYRIDSEETMPIQVEDLDEYQITAVNNGINENEYRQSPGRSRNFMIYDEADTRDRPVPIEANRHGAVPISGYENLNDGLRPDVQVYNVHGRFDSYVETTNGSMDDRHKATFPVFDRMKRPDENVFTFEDTNDDVHTVPGIINRREKHAVDDARESMSVAPSEKKVFYFDIDDLSQRLFSNGDQDLSRRLRKKKQKNARSHISRSTRARRKSKKSVFNLELDASTSQLLQGNDDTVVTEPPKTSNLTHRQFDARSVGAGDSRRALYVDTGYDISQPPRNSPKSSRNVPGPGPQEENEKPHRRNPSAGSQPLSPNSMVGREAVSPQQLQKTRSNPTSPRETTSVGGPEGSQTSSPRRSRRERPSPSDKMVQEKRGTKERSPREKTTSGSTPLPEVRSPKSPASETSKVYDDISDRLDHIVRREDDVQNRQKAIRAVFEEVQQHVAELKRNKHQAMKNVQGADEAKAESDAPNKVKAGGEGCEQVNKCLPGSSDIDATEAMPVRELEIKEEQATSVQHLPSEHEKKKETPADKDDAETEIEDTADNNNDMEENQEDHDDNHKTFKLGSDGDGEASKSQLSRPSAYLSSDNSCDDDINIQNETSDAGNDSVYVIDQEEEGENAMQQERLNEAKSGETTGTQGPRIINDSLPFPESKPSIENTDHVEDMNPDDDNAVTAEAVDDTNSDDAEDSEDFVGLASRTMEEARKRAIRGENIDENVLDSDPEEADVDIDAEFERVIPSNDDNDSPNVDYNIDETLDRVARQNELEKQNKGTTEIDEEPKDQNTPALEKPNVTPTQRSTVPSRRDDEEKANALLDGLAHSNLFADMEEQPQSPKSQLSHGSQRTVKSDKSDKSKRVIDDSNWKMQSSPVNTKEYEDSGEVVSVDYDFNLAISATTKSSDSSSDLQEFPMAHESRHDDEGSRSGSGSGSESASDSGTGSSNASSDISASSSDSVSSESSYDSFISIVETEDESDLEFFDNQEGFAENFLSNLVGSTFGWFEKKQEQLVCGFKSGEFDGPSLLRQSMTRPKTEEAEAEYEKSRNEAMANLHDAVATKYGRDNQVLPVASATVAEQDKKSKRSAQRKEVRRSDASKKKRPSSGDAKHSASHKRESLENTTAPHEIKGRKRNSEGGKSKHVTDSRKTSLVDSKSSESEFSTQAAHHKSNIAKGKPELTKKTTDPHLDGATLEKYHRPTNKKADSRKDESNTTRHAFSAETPLSPGTDMSGKISQYNFDFLTSDDDEAGPSSVKVIDVEMLGNTEKKTAKAHDMKKGAEKSHAKSSTTKEPSTLEILHDDEPEVVKIEDGDADTTAAARSKTRRSNKHTSSKTRTMSPISKSEQSSSSMRRGRATRSTSVSPKRRHDKSPSASSRHRERQMFGSVIKVEKPSKRRSSKTPSKVTPKEKSSSKVNPKESKASKKTSKKEKEKPTARKPSKMTPAGEKRSSRSSSRKQSSDSRNRARSPAIEDKRDESESDDNSMNMTAEEREMARKERRRAAALKRRRKLRERRRAKLEQSLTDDTFG